MIVKSHQEHNRPSDPALAYQYMGNEIADKAAQVALHHDLPQFLKLREDLQNFNDRSIKRWEQIYHSLYCIGTKFADHFRALPEDAPDACQPSQDANLPLLQLDPFALRSKHGAQILKGCVWGATYMSMLYSYLTMLDWSAQDHPTTQWVEL